MPLPGQSHIGPSMFGNLTPSVGPSAEDLETERQRVMFRKHVQINKHVVKIFDMHNKEDVVAYEKLMKKLIMGVQAKTHQIWCNDRELLTRDGKQGWQRYVEWSEFELQEEATPPVGVSA